jgi:hypothetical protein
VSTSNGKRVGHALVRFVGARGLTNGRGVVLLRAELSGPGRYTARASKSGLASARTTVRALRER